MTTVEFLKHVGSRMLGALLALPDLEPASSSDQVLSARYVYGCALSRKFYSQSSCQI